MQLGTSFLVGASCAGISSSSSSGLDFQYDPHWAAAWENEGLQREGENEECPRQAAFQVLALHTFSCCHFPN
jgi:hypothetical protein